MPDTQGLPWPKGDPGAARAAAHRASALAGSLRALGYEVGATSAAGWSGQAASAFHGADRGTAFGLVVCAASYAGWIPAVGVLPPPHRDNPRRAWTMLIGHVIYGSVLGAFVDRDFLSVPDAESIGRGVLADNVRKLHGLS